MRSATRRAKVPFLAVATLALACGPRPDQGTAGEPAGAERIENPALGIALVGAGAAGFELVTNEGETLALMRPATAEEAEATLSYEASPPQLAGVNLVEAVNQQKAAIEARPEGRFFGQIQLMSQLGNAYSTRGRYAAAGGETEEIRVFAVHPAGDRLLSLSYRYRPAAGDAGSKARSEQAMAALGLVEPLAAASPSPEQPPES
ncbi:MAG: hypothetical protein ACREKH_00565 [Candidatus Rokuibacteriota bacterium]